MQVLIEATSIGGNAGPFNIYQNFDSYATPVVTGITRSQILAGYTVTFNDATTAFRLTSTGICTNSTDINLSADITSCSDFTTNNIYLKVNWFGSGSINTNSGATGNSGYCGDATTYYAYVGVEFYKNSALTIPYYLTDIRISGLSTTSLGLKAIGIGANAGLTGGILTNNQSSVTFQSVAYLENTHDVDQANNCTNVTNNYGLQLTFGCSTISSVTVQENNNTF
jgi:hypothetical protein